MRASAPTRCSAKSMKTGGQVRPPLRLISRYCLNFLTGKGDLMYILIAILMFGVLIFVHELGHFLTAKALDVQVNEFSICMGPALWKKQRGETLYALRCIPIGGYCAMEGEDERVGQSPRLHRQSLGGSGRIILVAGSVDELSDRPARAGHSSTPRVAGFSTAKHRPASSTDCPLSVRAGASSVDDELYKIDGRRVFIYSDVGTLLGQEQDGQVRP